MFLVKALKEPTYAEKIGLTIHPVYINKAKVGLSQKKMLIERDGKTFMMTVWYKPGFGANKREKAKLFEDNKEQASMRQTLKDRGIPVSMAYKINRMASKPDAPLQCVIENAQGKTKYLYTKEHDNQKAAEKWARIAELDKARPKIAKQLDKDFNKSDEAKVLYLMNKTGMRVGGSTDSGSVGASSLESKHIKVDGNNITFTFPQKGNKPMQTSVEDAKLAKFFKGKEGKLFDTTDEKCRDYLKKIYPEKEFKTHDLRDYYATSMAAVLVKQAGKAKDEKHRKSIIKQISIAVSEKLGNTPKMALEKYIHPNIWEKL